ncbi:MAG: cupredoxin domain-containing protein, partial [Actinobacteria bacterium]|nr:cupredoxin domain-containing protein [Actinomycetota bacterium]
KQGYIAALVPASLALISLAGVIGATGSMLRGRAVSESGSMHIAALVVQVIIAAFVLAVGTTIVQQRDSRTAPPRAGEPVVEMRDVAYVPAAVTLRSGSTIVVRNADLFWHTFTVAGTKIDLGLATHGTERATIALPAGTYTYYCRVPGHRQAGMKGTLVVR